MDRIIWNITDNCNYSCEYCFNKNQFRLFRPGVDLLKAAQQMEGNEIIIAGGEPLLADDIVQVANELSAKNKVKINTNLSVHLSGFSKDIEFIASYHPLQADKETFLKHCNMLINNGNQVRATMVMHPKQMASFEALRKEFRKAGIELSAKTFRGIYAGKEYPFAYTEEEKRIIRKYGHHPDNLLVDYDTFDFRGRNCSAGSRFIFIDESGFVYRCPGDRKLGHIAKVYRAVEPGPCQKEKCSCPKFALSGLLK